MSEQKMTAEEQAQALVAKWKRDATLLPEPHQHDFESELTAGLTAALLAAHRAGRQAGLEEAAQFISSEIVEPSESFTEMAFNDACRDLADWCRTHAKEGA